MKDSLSGGKKNKTDALSALRQMKTVFPKNIGSKFLFELTGSLPPRKSGFVRVIKTGNRRSDSAKMALIEIIKKEEVKK